MNDNQNAKITACALNPADESMYCALNTLYLVKFDDQQIGYVAKLAKGTSAMTFGYGGWDGELFYEGSSYAGLYKIGADNLDGTSIANLPVYANQGSLQNTAGDVSDDDPIDSEGLSGAQDLVATDADLEGDGKSTNADKQYLITMNVVWEVFVVRAHGGYKKWKLATTGDKLGAPTSFGSGWALEDEDGSMRYVFAEDSGMGNYEVKDINLKEGTATIKRMGAAHPPLNPQSGSPVIKSSQNSKMPGTQCTHSKLPKLWKAQETNKPTFAPSKCLPGYVEKNPCGCRTTTRCAKAPKL